MVVSFDQQPLIVLAVHSYEHKLTAQLQAKKRKNDLPRLVLLERITLRLVLTVVPNADVTGAIAALADRSFVIDI